jgi:hypothetical protein
MDHNLDNRAFKTPPGVGAGSQHAHESQQNALAHERQRRTVEQSLLLLTVKPKKAT